MWGLIFILSKTSTPIPCPVDLFIYLFIYLQFYLNRVALSVKTTAILKGPVYTKSIQH